MAIIEPSDKHYYQPLWTLVGGGCAPAKESERHQAQLIPQGVTWLRERATGIDPSNQTVTTGSEKTIGYDYLVVAPGIQLDWDKVTGLSNTLGKDAVSSIYQYELAPKTWEFLKNLRAGTAVFTMPSGPIKCAGALRRLPIWHPTTGSSKASCPTSV